MELIRIFHNGGTDYRLAFHVAADALNWSTKEFSKADVIFISDGIFPMGQIETERFEFLKALEQAEAKCLGIFVGADPQGKETFREFCNGGTWGINHTDTGKEDAQILTELFQGI